jgi:hypothetical protein
MKIIDGTFTFNLGVDEELERETKEYLNSVLVDIDLSTRDSYKELVKKVSILPADKQLYLIFAVLDANNVSPEFEVIEVLRETTGEEFGTKKKRKEVTREKYPELFEKSEIKIDNFHGFLGHKNFNKFRELIPMFLEEIYPIKVNTDYSKYEEEFGIKINISGESIR